VITVVCFYYPTTPSRDFSYGATHIQPHRAGTFHMVLLTSRAGTFHMVLLTSSPTEQGPFIWCCSHPVLQFFIQQLSCQLQGAPSHFAEDKVAGAWR